MVGRSFLPETKEHLAPLSKTNVAPSCLCTATGGSRSHTTSGLCQQRSSDVHRVQRLGGAQKHYHESSALSMSTGLYCIHQPPALCPEVCLSALTCHPQRSPGHVLRLLMLSDAGMEHELVQKLEVRQRLELESAVRPPAVVHGQLPCPVLPLHKLIQAYRVRTCSATGK